MYIFHPIAADPIVVNRIIDRWRLRQWVPVNYSYGWWHLQRSSNPEAELGDFVLTPTTPDAIILSPQLAWQRHEQPDQVDSNDAPQQLKSFNSQLQSAWSSYARRQTLRGGLAVIIAFVALTIGFSTLARWGAAVQIAMTMLTIVGFLLLIGGLWALLRAYYNGAVVATWPENANRANSNGYIRYYIIVDRSKLPGLTVAAINAQIESASDQIGHVRLISADHKRVYAGVYGARANENEIQAVLAQRLGKPEAVRVTASYIYY